MNNLFKNSKKWVLGLAMAIVVFGSTISVNATQMVGWPTNSNYQSNQPWIANPNYPDTALKSGEQNGAGAIYANGSPRREAKNKIQYNSYINLNEIINISKPLNKQSYVFKQNYIWSDTFFYNPTYVDLSTIMIYMPVFAPSCIDEESCAAVTQKGASGSKVVNAGQSFCGTDNQEECYYRAGSAVPQSQYVQYNFHDLMTGGEVKQKHGESYEQFQKRLPALSYGLYKNESNLFEANNSITLVANFGTMGDNGFTIDKGRLDYKLNGENATATGTEDIAHVLACMTLQGMGVYQGEGQPCDGVRNLTGSSTLASVPADLKNYDGLFQYYKTVYGSDNQIGGNAYGFIVSVEVGYAPSSYTNSTLTWGYRNQPLVQFAVECEEQDPIVTKAGVNNKQGSTPGQLAQSAIPAAAPGEASLFLFDRTYSYYPVQIKSPNPLIKSADNAYAFPAIEGATFTLQKQNGTNWDIVKSGLKTDANGMINVSGLDGTYRFVQESAQQNSYKVPYDLNISCSQYIGQSYETIYNSATASNGFLGGNKVGCEYDETGSEKLLVSKPMTIDSTTGANAYIGNLISLDDAAKIFTIDYVTNGGTYNDNNPVTYKEGVGVASFEPSTRDGYFFKGWYDSEDFENEVTSLSNEATGNKTLYAKWERDLSQMDITDPVIINPNDNNSEVTTEVVDGVIKPKDELPCGDEQLKIKYPGVEGMAAKLNYKYTMEPNTDEQGNPITNQYKVSLFEIDLGCGCEKPAETFITSWVIELPEIKPCDVEQEVTPIAPGIEYVGGAEVETTLDDTTGKVTVKDVDALACGKELQVKLPTVENLTYTSEKISAEGVYPIQYKVTATPADGYVVSPSDARTEWTVEIPEIPACPVEPEKVEVIEPGIEYVDGASVETNIDAQGNVTVKDPSTLACGQELQPIVPASDDKVTYTSTKTSAEGVYPMTFKVEAKLAEGYVVTPENALTEWTVIIPKIEACEPNTVSPIAPGIEYENGDSIETTMDANGKVTVKYIDDIACGEKLQLVLPKSDETISYKATKTSAEGVYPIVYSVEATPGDGYTITPEDARTQWTVEIPESKACPVEDVYTITYVLYGGTNNASNPSTYVAGKGVAKFEEPTLANGKFIKWYMLKDDIMKVRDSRVSFDDLEEITGLSDKQTGNVTIYARWFVTPVTPKLDTKNSSCEVDHKVIIPKQEGIKFTTTQEGKIVKVKATIENDYKEGYVFADGAKTEWTFDVTNSEKCPTGPGTTNPTNPLPGTGSELMLLGLSLITITGIGLVGYRRLSNK